MEVLITVNFIQPTLFVVPSLPIQQQPEAPSSSLQEIEFGPILRTGQLLEAGHPVPGDLFSLQF